MSQMMVTTDFRLYHSNALDVLAGLLAETLRSPVPGQSLLVPDTILIPQAAMRRWLQATLATTHGVVANLEFLTPGEFVARALDANLGAVPNALDTAVLHWRLYAALRDPALLTQPALAELHAYLADGDLFKPWTLAEALSAAFEKYQAWRCDWLLRWEAGADPDDPQAILWRHSVNGATHRARRIHDYLNRYGSGTAPPPQGLPARLFIFATLNISPDVLRVLATQAQVGTLHFYLPTPTKEYWGDAQPFTQRLHQPTDCVTQTGENRLLHTWGAAGRDFMTVLGNYEVVHPSGEITAYDDPEQRPGTTLDEGGLRDSLLQRLHADLFHNRSAPVPAPLPAPRLEDPSLQFHACHTRLRELQVLHDRLRALLEPNSPEGQRFNPPLQPREIAVLAPDIDLYIPYLEAVFGGHAHSDPLPYTLADASPLIDEPLAEVFLRLLDLPVSRFGLHEILDLLASLPMATLAGFDTQTLEILRSWLTAAGARWGLDAAHRAEHQAPADDAYTWSFALDRLLLGHASGADADIAGVAAWPDLEGSMLTALDTLIRLLRVLANTRQRLSEALLPTQWRERLLSLLDALLPDIPTAPSGIQRPLERLRRLIDTFATDATRAGVALPVPAEVVRMHFAALLADTDTRAPLLTGGISIGRMVPMRLLPFRVICLLGMNDGDFPRRDPAAGLNRLTAELGTAQRRPGDRSRRDDDCLLLLQLFSAAQDVFYVSYLGADPHDGSLREPSPLLTELLSTAATYHADPSTAAKTLLLRHSLQPFSPTAFGVDGDPRRFSYHPLWQAAAASIEGQRHPLAPWCPRRLPALPDPEPALPLHSLRRFFSAPAEQFLQQRLGLRLPEPPQTTDECDPLWLPSHGLERHRLDILIFASLLHETDDTLYPQLRARALLPSGPLGQQQLQERIEHLRPYAQAFAHWRGTALPQSRCLEVMIDGIRLHAHIQDLYPHGIARLRLGPPNGPAVLRHGLDWLLASAAGHPWPLVRFEDAGVAGLGPHLQPSLPSSQAQTALTLLLRLRTAGLRQPLPFAPYSAWEYYTQRDTPERALQTARARWRGNDHQWGESNHAAIQLALRNHDPFATPQTAAHFAQLATLIFDLLTTGQADPEPLTWLQLHP
ncbi:exodeoxyribonuclease V subunit gamma [Xylella fastidiosa]|uniref:RecBCD enzyme subunit RecC n=2 Tax=Xylella fastidiosa TaxID=2371 RepID=A0A060H3K4_XYLFS|nr:exodeoxyribonuclease V subunit gamma [Xylella fastidiosa]AIC10163.1 exodeoxyribonuclease V subunit gamma [Xylella fastidiosa subsp. sandyi Ann-1]UIX82087.1 exodeoxyribonuclease V subunit gamma [Xylella fastidiosa subsp. sandyi]